MGQLHKRFATEQVKVLLQGYLQGTIERSEVEEIMQIKKTRFFRLLKDYRQAPQAFTITYERATSPRLSAETEAAITTELLREKALVEDPDLPITSYNYSAMRDRLKTKGYTVSATTITKRAKELGCYLPHRKHKVHDREVITTTIGALIQHDASTHRWSPFAGEKWTLITSLDDYSRKLLFADFFLQETSWAHIQAAQSVLQAFGLPVSYYVGNLRVFRFVQKRDSAWRKHILVTDDIDPQWRQVMRLIGVEVTYALSPQAKGTRSNALIAGCRTVLFAPVPWKNLPPWKMYAASFATRSTVITITRSIPPPVRSPISASRMPKVQAPASSALFLCLNLILPQKMSSVCVAHVR
jgi:hypothetical protein